MDAFTDAFTEIFGSKRTGGLHAEMARKLDNQWWHNPSLLGGQRKEDTQASWDFINWLDSALAEDQPIEFKSGYDANGIAVVQISCGKLHWHISIDQFQELRKNWPDHLKKDKLHWNGWNINMFGPTVYGVLSTALLSTES